MSKQLDFSPYNLKVGNVAFDKQTAFTLCIILLQVNPASEKSGVNRLDFARQVLPSMPDLAKTFAGQTIEIRQDGVGDDEGKSWYASLKADDLVTATKAVIDALSAREAFEATVKHWAEGTSKRGRQAGTGFTPVINIPAIAKAK